MTPVFLILCLLAYGHSFVLNTTTHLIQRRLTHTMTLRCALEGSLPSRNFSKDLADRDVSHVTSLTLTRDGSDVATVTKFDPAKIMLEPVRSNLQVWGSVGGGLGVDGYLELQWSYPGEEDSGQYTCEVSGLTDHGHCVSFTRSLTINYTDSPTIDDLVSHIYDQQQEIARLQKKVESLETTDTSQPINVQNGNIDIDSDDWTRDYNYGHSYWYKYEASVSFKKPYTSPPVVSLNMAQFSTNGHHSFDLKLVSVTKTGFQMSVKTYTDGNRREDSRVAWLSVPTQVEL